MKDAVAGLDARVGSVDKLKVGRLHLDPARFKNRGRDG
jgi:hypothetical protein